MGTPDTGISVVSDKTQGRSLVLRRTNEKQRKRANGNKPVQSCAWMEGTKKENGSLANTAFPISGSTVKPGRGIRTVRIGTETFLSNFSSKQKVTANGKWYASRAAVRIYSTRRPSQKREKEALCLPRSPAHLILIQRLGLIEKWYTVYVLSFSSCPHASKL